MGKQVSAQEIINYYTFSEVDYRWLWHLNKVNALHYGFWDENTVSLRSALKNMNQYVRTKLELCDGLDILDAGCGIGGSVFDIAKLHKVNITGITLSKPQVLKAKKMSAELSLLGKTEFLAQDFTNTTFQSASFDRIYAIESVCHANEKADFLNESYRLLKPSSYLVVAGFFMNDHAFTDKEQQIMDDWARSWAVPFFEKHNVFQQKAETIGFEVIENNDITHHIQKSAKRLYYMFYPGIISHHVLKALRLRNDVQGRNVWSTYHQYQALKRNLWSYKVFKFKKPS